MVNGREKRRAAIVFKKRSGVMCDDGANDERSARVNFNVIPYSSNRLPVCRHYPAKDLSIEKGRRMKANGKKRN
jgi:hypothetical protein